MIVRFTVKQWEWVRQTLTNPEWVDVADQYELWFDSLWEPSPASDKRVDVMLPYAGWVCAQNRLFELVYNMHGRVAEHTPKYRVLSLRAITNATSFHASAPAFRHAGVFGWSTTLYPAWADIDDTHRAPIPINGWQFMALRPTEVGGLTTWIAWAGHTINSPLFIEGNHRAFLRSQLWLGPLTPQFAPA